jgi:hypothetical protein
MLCRSILGLLTLLVIAPVARAQSPATQELLALVPKEFGFCVVLNDVRGTWQRLENAPWFTSLKASPLGQAILTAPEFRDLKNFERDLKQHLDVDLATLRDDLLGDAAVFAYRPPQPGQPDEHGLFLVKARRLDALTRVIDRLNELQKQSGELKALDERQHGGVTYFRRVHDRNTHYYLQRGPVLVLSGKEEVIKAVIDIKGEAAPVYSALRRAGAEKAVAALWLNPRIFDAEIESKAEKKLAAEGKLLGGVLGYWKAVDGIVVAVDAQEHLEARLSLLVRTGDLPDAARKWFERPPQASALWRHFPKDSILAIAGRADFSELFDGLSELAPEKDRKTLMDAARKTVGAALGLDPFKDALPNIGPDWGLCVLPSNEAQQFPQALFALGVKPFPKQAPTDQAVYRALQFAMTLAIFAHNSKHDEQIRMGTAVQGSVEIKYLEGDKVFPPGFRPAVALKDGYLVVATAPEAIAAFVKREGDEPATDGTLFLRFAPVQLAKLIRHQRDKLANLAAERPGGPSRAAAEKNLDNLAQVLELFEQATLSQRIGEDELTWILRVRMAE